jgi:outer membrane protein assembly factor BamB
MEESLAARFGRAAANASGTLCFSSQRLRSAPFKLPIAMSKPKHSRCAALAVVCALFLFGAARPAAAAHLIDQRQAGQYGLKRAWFGQVNLDPGADKLANLTQQTSFDPAVTYQVFEVTTEDGRSYSYSQRDRGPFGRPLGVEDAKKLAQARLDLLTTEGAKAKLVERVIPHTILMAQTDRGMLHVFDAETGATLWSRNVGRSDHPSTAAGANDKYVAMLNGLMLFVFNRADGRLAFERKVGGAPSAGPALSTDIVFIPMAGGKIEGYKLETPRDPPWTYKASGHIRVQPTITPRSVVFATDRGWMYVSRPDNPAVRFRLEARGAILTAPAYQFPMIYAASEDGYAYAMHETAGGTAWRFAAGMPIEQPLAAIGNAVYVSPERGGMYRLDATTGAEVWQARQANRFLAASATRVYAVDLYNRLTVVDNQNGGVIGQISTDRLDMPIVNQETDRLYLAHSKGLIQCLHEIDADRPYLHITAKPTEAPVAKKPDAAAPPADGEMPADDAEPGAEFPSNDAPADEAAPADVPAGDAAEMPADDAPADAATPEGIANELFGKRPR